MTIDLQVAKEIYRCAIDPRAQDAEGVTWWAEVATEMTKVVEAPSASAAASVIVWWHHDWSSLGDTAMRAARRIRTTAARLAKSSN